MRPITQLLTAAAMTLPIVACAQTPTTTPEVRGTWMTTTANDAISTPQRTAETMKQLRDIGLNTVYVEVWKNGYTEFPSDVMNELIGVPMKVNAAPPELQRDLLEETLIEAHRNGMVYHAWFEYGFMAAFKDTQNELRTRYADWLTQTADGSVVSKQNPFVWLNPLRPESRKLLTDIVVEAIQKYDLDGVQLDDRIAWPVTMGYDPYTVEVYKKEHNGKAPPKNHEDPAWIQWRADKVTEYAKEFYDACKAANPNVLVSISPAVYPWSLDNYACDWKTWNDKGWMDEFVPQNYRMNYAAFATTWKDQLAAAGKRKADLIAGIRIVGDGPDSTWDDLQKSIELTRKPMTGGHVHWFSRGVLDVYPSELKAFYNVAEKGHAPHPKFIANPRPMPVVLSQGEANTWSANEVPVGQYRAIVQRDGRWSYADDVNVDDMGSVTLTVADAQAVELLIDRRRK